MAFIGGSWSTRPRTDNEQLDECTAAADEGGRLSGQLNSNTSGAFDIVDKEFRIHFA